MLPNSFGEIICSTQEFKEDRIRRVHKRKRISEELEELETEYTEILHGAVDYDEMRQKSMQKAYILKENGNKKAIRKGALTRLPLLFSLRLLENLLTDVVETPQISIRYWTIRTLTRIW